MKLIATTFASLLLVGAGVSASQAAVVPVGPSSDVTAGGVFVGAINSSSAGNAFDDAFTFSSAGKFSIDITFLTTTSKPGALKTLSYALYSGLFGSGTLVTPIVLNSFSSSGASATFSSGLLQPGQYYFEASGTTTKLATIGETLNFAVSAVPLPSTLPMFGAALLALGGAAALRSRKTRDEGPTSIAAI